MPESIFIERSLKKKRQRVPRKFFFLRMGKKIILVIGSVYIRKTKTNEAGR